MTTRQATNPDALVETRRQKSRSGSVAGLLGRRAAWSVATVLIATLAIFLLLNATPGTVAHQIAGADASQDDIARVEQQLGLDKPVLERYATWLGHAVHGDLETSYVTRQPVTEMIMTALPVTMSLLIVSSVLAVLIAVIAALVCAHRPNGLADRVIVVVSTVALAVPSFWLAILLVRIFAVDAGWFPAVGYLPLSKGFGQWLAHLILPSVVLASVFASEVARQLRGSLYEVSKLDFILSARARGLGQWRVLAKHGLKPAAVPAVTIFAVRVAQLLGGTIVIERVFNLNGLGNLMVTAVLSRDMPVVLGVIVVFTLIVIAINLMTDSLQVYFDPRIRTE